MGAQWKNRIRQASGAAKGKVFSKLAKEIVLAAKAGADPAMNARLRTAVETARKASMPRDTLERAIKKGAGLLDDKASYETLIIEGFAPHRVPVMVECVTDNTKRTLQNLRYLFRNGQLTPVAWDFAHVGLIDATAPADADPEEVAIETGAQDVERDGEGEIRFYTEPADLDAVSHALSTRGWTVATMRLGWRAKNPVHLADPGARAEVEQFLADLDEDDDVQNIDVGLAG